VRTAAASANPNANLCVTWSVRRVEYRIDSAGSARTPGESEFGAIDNAFATWQALAQTCSDFEFVRGPRIADAGIGKPFPEDNVLVFREENCRDIVPVTARCQSDGSCGNAYHCWEHGDGTIALTTSTYSTRTGVVSDSDIEFNAGKASDGTRFLFTTIASPPCSEGKESAFCTAYDIQNTATHEIGHLVGLDHVSGNLASTMAPTAPLADLQKRAIDPGTGAGFCGTYPTGKPPVPCDELAQLKNRITGRSVGTPGCTCAQWPMLESTFLWLVLVCRSRLGASCRKRS
jgi:hypothetical protein